MKAPPPPPPPPATPQYPDQAVRDTGNLQGQQAASNGGYAATIATGGQGLTEPANTTNRNKLG